MKTLPDLSALSKGIIHFYRHSTAISDMQWNPHPKFRGVSLKHLITGDNTGGLFSSHLVRIDSNCVLDSHCHEHQMELHEIVDGDGVCFIGEACLDYCAGKMALIPNGVFHKIIGGKTGIVLLAKFMPALV